MVAGCDTNEHAAEVFRSESVLPYVPSSLLQFWNTQVITTEERGHRMNDGKIVPIVLDLDSIASKRRYESER